MKRKDMIKKMEEESYSVEVVDLPKESVTELPLNDFYYTIGDNISYLKQGKSKTTKIFYNDNNFYKRKGSEWLKTSSQVQEEIIHQDITNQELMEKLTEVIDWCEKVIDYLNKKRILYENN